MSEVLRLQSVVVCMCVCGANCVQAAAEQPKKEKAKKEKAKKEDDDEPESLHQV